MMRKGTDSFHSTSFDPETLLKLKIFRMYVREWLPVFLVKRSRPFVNIFDFFAGPGADPNGNLGSPLIILEEVYNYYLNYKVDPMVHLAMNFNDIDSENTKRLIQRIDQFPVDPRWKISVDNLDFTEAFSKYHPLIANKDSANLVIIDQFGFKHMPPEVFAGFASCEATDLICFVSSSFIRRFIKEPSTQRHIPISPKEMESVPASEVHRYVCDYYRSLIPDSVRYHVAPFSIKSQANVYGLIFGSSSLLGLEKFLKVCWGLDEFTGEANFAIDNDLVVTMGGEKTLFDEYNIPKKQKEFTENLVAFLLQGNRTNRDVYRFTLENGFLPHQTNVLLKSWQENNILVVKEMDGTPARKGSYYVNWDHYKTVVPQVVFSYKGSAI